MGIYSLNTLFMESSGVFMFTVWSLTPPAAGFLRVSELTQIPKFGKVSCFSPAFWSARPLVWETCFFGFLKP